MDVHVGAELYEHAEIIHPHQPVGGPKPRGYVPLGQGAKEYEYCGNIVTGVPVRGERPQQQGCCSSELNAREQRRTKTRILEDAIISVGFHIAESQQSHDLLLRARWTQCTFQPKHRIVPQLIRLMPSAESCLSAALLSATLGFVGYRTIHQQEIKSPRRN